MPAILSSCRWNTIYSPGHAGNLRWPSSGSKLVLTGMGSDGTAGCIELKKKGAGIIVQDEATCVVYGMPKGPVDEGIADAILPIDKIASKIIETVMR